ncbi:alpha/beta fold hydrolase [Streptomyces sp. M19]
MWDRQIPELSRHWRVLRYDLPGHGGSHALPAASVSELADRMVATLDQLGVDRFGYAGCSIGAAVGAELALRYPHRLGSLALVAASPRFADADSFRQRAATVRGSGLDRSPGPRRSGGSPGVRRRPARHRRLGRPDGPHHRPACYIAACEALAAFDVRAELGAITMPTLVLVGADDQVTPAADARVLVQGIRDARLALVPGASHLAPSSNPRPSRTCWCGTSPPPGSPRTTPPA